MAACITNYYFQFNAAVKENFNQTKTVSTVRNSKKLVARVGLMSVEFIRVSSVNFRLVALLTDVDMIRSL